MNARRRRIPATPAPSRSSAFIRSWRPVLLFSLCVIAYANSLSHPFVLDDVGTLANDSLIQSWWTPQGLLSSPASAVAGRPVVQLSLALNHSMGGRDVRGFRIWNLGVHALCALLLFGLVRRTLALPDMPEGLQRRAPDLAFAAAALWAVHPLNSEVVNYIVQRTESMMALCYLATLYASVRAMTATAPVGWQMGAILACATGMGCKESMASAPLLVILYDRIFVSGSFSRAFAARGRFHLGLLATLAIVIPIALAAPRADSAGFATGVSPWNYLLNQTVMVARYVTLAVWPRSLVAFYGWPSALTLTDVIPTAAAVASLLALTAAALAYRPALGFLGAWFFVTLAPASSIIPIATEVGAERRMYLPLMALTVMCALAMTYTMDAVSARVSQPTTSGARGLMRVALAILVAALAWRTVGRNAEYSSELTLARTIVERWPTSIAHQILGDQLLAAGNREEGLAELMAAVPGDSMARYPLGLELFREGRFNESIEQLTAFVGTWRLPYRLVPHWLEPSTTEVVNARTTMAQALAREGRWSAVLEQCRLILAVHSSSADAYGLMGDAFFSQQQFNDAVTAYRRQAELQPANSEALTQLGVSFISLGKLSEATGVFQQAVDIDPANWRAQRNLATALVDSRDFAGAVLHARQAIRLKSDDAVAHEMLGRALSALGQSDGARVELERAVALDPNDAQAREELKRLASLKNH